MAQHFLPAMRMAGLHRAAPQKLRQQIRTLSNPRRLLMLCALAMVLLGVCAHATIGVDAMLQAVKFPAGVTSLDTGLTEMDRDTFYIIPL